MTRTARATMVWLVMAASAACGRSSDGPADVSGVIATVRLPDPALQELAVLHVRPAGDTTSSTAPETVVTLTGDSEVYVTENGVQRRADYRVLEAGQTIEAWFAEGTGETNPAAHQARRIVVADRQ